MAIAKDTTMEEGWHGKITLVQPSGGRGGGPENSANGGDWGPNHRNWPQHLGPHWRCTEPIRTQTTRVSVSPSPHTAGSWYN